MEFHQNLQTHSYDCYTGGGGGGGYLISIAYCLFFHLRLWLSWKSRQYEFVRTTSIINFVFSGVLRGAWGRHV